jgi:hypothetical protein
MIIFSGERWRKIAVAVTWFLLFLSGITTGYAWRMKHETTVVKYTYMLSPELEELHRQQAKKHGLYHGEPVFQDPLGWYFIRDGKRCPYFRATKP